MLATLSSFSFPKTRITLAAGILLIVGAAHCAEPQSVRVGVLKFGTVQWELDTIKARGLDRDFGVSVAVVELAGKDATAIALQARAVDLIVTDFIWVSRQRAEGADYRFVPHSLNVGGVMVRPGSGIKGLSDLKGNRIGVAGGPVDKSWLLLRAYARKTLGADLAAFARPAFAAPPLLNELLLRGELDAGVNFWNYNAYLKTRGMTELMSVAEIMVELGLDPKTPLLGWVFSDAWAKKNAGTVRDYLKASRAAKAILTASDAEWDRLRPLMRADDETTFRFLRDSYRAGIAGPPSPADSAAAEKMFALLADIGGPQLIGRSSTLMPGTFYHAESSP